MGTRSHHSSDLPPPSFDPTQATEMADCNKVDDGLKKEIEAGKTLKDTPVPETGVNTHDATLAGIAHFNKDKLSSVKTEEKVVLPSAEILQQRRQHQAEKQVLGPASSISEENVVKTE